VTAPDECGFAVMLLRSLLTVSDGEEPELTGEDFEQAKNRSLYRGAREGAFVSASGSAREGGEFGKGSPGARTHHDHDGQPNSFAFA